jgi:hypothetical protein
MDEYFPVVVQAIPGPDRTIYVYFSDGRITQFDMKPLIKPDNVLKVLADDDFFAGRLTVLNGTAAWDVSGRYDPTTCIDLDPFILHDAPRVSDPLEQPVS